MLMGIRARAPALAYARALVRAYAGTRRRAYARSRARAYVRTGGRERARIRERACAVRAYARTRACAYARTHMRAWASARPRVHVGDVSHRKLALKWRGQDVSCQPALGDEQGRALMSTSSSDPEHSIGLSTTASALLLLMEDNSHLKQNFASSRRNVFLGA